MIAALLLSSARPAREWRNPISSLALLQFPNDSARIDTTKVTVRIEAGRPIIHRELQVPRLPVDNDAITLSPPDQQQQHIDWDRESALAAQSSVVQAAKERNYRDLSGLTPEQLAWVKKNHVEPMPGFKWNRNNRGEMLRHGIVKLNDYCVLIVVIPFCRFGGKIQYSDDLFKDMHDPKSPDQ
ncbi:MAG: hypothetical protein M3O41_02695 [Pseudomonadota bacterium]|nr:hypothetical protein [Pseudomonadota bacterium]